MMCRNQFLTVSFLIFLPFWVLNAQCLAGDCLHGTGTMLYPSGSKYVGQFVNGKHHGGGTLFYADGSRYQGAWKYGKMEGLGAETLPDGTLRKGTWENGRLINLQNEKLDTKSKGPVQQMGCISGDCLNGKGYYMFATGAVYIGEFLNGEIHGYGTCYYPNGTIYKGYWAHRFPEGQGTKTYEDGSKRIGLWKKGQPVDEFGNFVDDQKSWLTQKKLIQLFKQDVYLEIVLTAMESMLMQTVAAMKDISSTKSPIIKGFSATQVEIVMKENSPKGCPMVKERCFFKVEK